MLLQKYEYKGVVIEAVYETKYVIVRMYRDCVRVHESITYMDFVNYDGFQIFIKLIETFMEETFELEKLDIVRTEYFDD